MACAGVALVVLVALFAVGAIKLLERRTPAVYASRLLPVCLACGYDLRGLAEGACCPECGGAGRKSVREIVVPEARSLRVEEAAGLIANTALVALVSALLPEVWRWVYTMEGWTRPVPVTIADPRVEYVFAGLFAAPIGYVLTASCHPARGWAGGIVTGIAGVAGVGAAVWLAWAGDDVRLSTAAPLGASLAIALARLTVWMMWAGSEEHPGDGVASDGLATSTPRA